MAKASDNPFPYVRVVPAAAPGSAPASSQYLYLDSGDSNKLKRKDSSGTVVSIESSGSGYGSWGSYTPVIKGATTDPTMGTASVLTGAYREDSATVEVEVYGKFGTSGVAAGTGSYYYFTLPVTPTVAYHSGGNPIQIIGHGWHLDASTGAQKQLIVKVFPDSTHFVAYVDQATTIFGPAAPVAPAINDEFGMILHYRK